MLCVVEARLPLGRAIFRRVDVPPSVYAFCWQALGRLLSGEGLP